MNVEQIYNKLKEISGPYNSWINQMNAIAKWIHEHYEQKQNPKDDERKKIAAIIYARLLDQYGLIPIQETYKMKEVAIKATLMTDILLEEINNKSNG